MSTFEESKRQFIFDEVFDHFIDLAKNTNGLCVVKRLVQIYSPEEIVLSKNPGEKPSQLTFKQRLSLKLLQKIHDNVIDLVQDPFGNYAVTEVIIVRFIALKSIDMAHLSEQAPFRPD
jgi:hypothetical protein